MMYRRKATNIDSNIYLKQIDSFNEEIEEDFKKFILEIRVFL